MKIKLLYIVILVTLSGCHKTFLEEPTSKALVIPKTYQDLNALLQFTNEMNVGAFNSVTSDGEFLFTEAYLNTTDIITRNLYLWKADVYETILFSPAWRAPFKQVLNANIVLEESIKLKENISKEQLDNLRGTALFFRAMGYTELILNFTPPYDPGSSTKQMGLPLRRNSNVSEIMSRSNLKETMGFILADLNEAVTLLPNKSTMVTQPNKAAVFALLARNYLAMQEYEKALSSSMEALKIQGNLIDYNAVPIRTPHTFSDPLIVPNPEVLFYQYSNQSAITRNTAFQVRQEVLDLYANNDLRKARYFNSNKNFIGTYLGNNFFFSGIATDEVWLIAAESASRLGKIDMALEYLNTLCQNRYDKGSFTPYLSSDKNEILKWTLQERRKELITRSRWFDLRRLNSDPAFASVLTRVYKSHTYSLPSKSSRYTFAIPQEEISFSGIEQYNRVDND